MKRECPGKEQPSKLLIPVLVKWNLLPVLHVNCPYLFSVFDEFTAPLSLFWAKFHVLPQSHLWCKLFSRPYPYTTGADTTSDRNSRSLCEGDISVQTLHFIFKCIGQENKICFCSRHKRHLSIYCKCISCWYHISSLSFRKFDLRILCQSSH